MADPVCTIVTGPPRVGKTCRVVMRLIDEFLVFGEATLYTNMPLKVDVIADKVAPFIASRKGVSLGVARDEVLQRVVVIPGVVLAKWNCGDETVGFKRGECPGVWFGSRIQPGDVIAIDEAHMYIPKEADKTYPDLVHEWKVWLSQLGHPGAHLELMTQDQWMISESIRALTSVIIRLSPVDETRDEFTGCRLDDQWQLFAKLRRQQDKYVSGYVEYVTQRTNNRFDLVEIDGKKERLIRFKPEWFECYDSNSRRDGDEGEAYVRELPKCQTLRWPWFLFWFFRRNAFALSARFTAAVTIICIFGGGWFWGRPLISYSMNTLSASIGRVAGSSADTGQQPEAAGLIPVSGRSSLRNPSVTQVAQAVAVESVDRLLWDSVIVLLSQRHLVFSSGQLVRVGELIQDGAYKGHTLKRIDLARRVAQLDDGRLVQIGGKPATGAVPGQQAVLNSPGRKAGSSSPAGPGVKPEFDPGPGGLVGSGVGGDRFVPTPAPRPVDAGARSASGDRFESAGRASDVRGGGLSGSGADQSGATSGRESGRSGDSANPRDGGKAVDSVRAGNGATESGYVVPSKRKP